MKTIHDKFPAIEKALKGRSIRLFNGSNKVLDIIFGYEPANPSLGQGYGTTHVQTTAGDLYFIEDDGTIRDADENGTPIVGALGKWFPKTEPIKLVFPLTLNKSDRAAIDWVGHRYSHGDELAEFLCDALPQGHSYEDFNFSDVEGDVQFDIPESEMDEYERLITEDGMACFSDELKHKLMTPLHHYLGGRYEPKTVEPCHHFKEDFE